MKAMINNVNIRGCEERKNQKGEGYLLVRFEDETGKAEEVVDKDMERKDSYKRDTIGDLYITITGGKYINVRVSDFRIKND